MRNIIHICLFHISVNSFHKEINEKKNSEQIMRLKIFPLSIFIRFSSCGMKNPHWKSSWRLIFWVLGHQLLILMEMDHGPYLDGRRRAEFFKFHFVGFPLKTFTSLNALPCSIKINLLVVVLCFMFQIVFNSRISNGRESLVTRNLDYSVSKTWLFKFLAVLCKAKH